MKKYKKIITSISILVLMVFYVLPVLADDYGLDDSAEIGYGTGEEKIAKENIPNQNIPATIGKIVGAGLSFIGVAFLILMIYAGLLWMFARGNEQNVTKAQDLIKAAVIGLIIVMSAYAITSYVGGILSK